MKNKKLYIVIGVIVVVLTLGGYALYEYFRRKKGSTTEDESSKDSSANTPAIVPTTTTTPSTPASTSTLLRMGSSGAEVRNLQTRLNQTLASAKAQGKHSNLSPIGVDGNFGAQTQARLQALFNISEIRFPAEYGMYEHNLLYGNSTVASISGTLVQVGAPFVVGAAGTGTSSSSNLELLANTYISEHRELGGGGRCLIYQRVMQLSDSDIRALDALIKKKDTYSRGLRSWYQATWVNDCPLAGVDWGARMISKLNQLGL